MKEIILSAVQPFSYQSVVRSHGWAQLAPFTWDRETDALAYNFCLESGRVVVLNFGSAENALLVSVSDDLSPDETQQVESAASWMFGLDQDLSSFYVLAQREPKLAHIVKNAQGRVLRSPTIFEDVVKTILTTNTQWGGTKRMVRELVDAYGNCDFKSETARAFPLPQAIAVDTLEAYNSKVRHGYRAPYILELAKRAADGELELESLKSNNLSTAEIRQQLLQIKGVGNYAAANLLMILGHYDTIPIDSWAHKVVSKEFFGGEPVTSAQIESIFEPWGDFKGLAYWFWQWDEF